MPRRPRLLTESGIYHIITRGNNRQALFRKKEDYNRYLDLFRKMKTFHRFEIYHYCLMKNHAHLLIKFYDEEGLQKVMQRINLTYAKQYRRAYQHCGHVFQDRFKSLPIEKDSYLLECGRYIERNPLKARLVSDPADYHWSSYEVYAFGKSDDLVSPSPLYTDLANCSQERQRLYREYVLSERPYEELVEEGLKLF